MLPKLALFTLLIFFAQQVVARQPPVVVIPFDFDDPQTQEKISNIIKVAKSGADFSNLNDAVDSISNSSATNRYLIKIAPGEYLIRRQLIMKPFVHIQGSGRDSTIFTSKIVGERTFSITGARETEFSDISINALSTALYPSTTLIRCKSGNSSSCPRIQNTSLTIRAGSSLAPVTTISIDGSELEISNSSVRATSRNSTSATAIEIFMGSMKMSNSTVLGTNTGILAGHDGQASITGSLIWGGFAIAIDDFLDFAAVTVAGSSIHFFNTGISNRTSNANKVRVHNTRFRGSDLSKTTDGNVHIKCVFSSTNDAEPLGANCKPIP